MNFFDILFWMGMLCLTPVPVIAVNDALRRTRQGRSVFDDSALDETLRPLHAAADPAPLLASE